MAEGGTKLGFWYVCFCQAEDGIRDRLVTGVQTCALPIYQPETEIHVRIAATFPNGQGDVPANLGENDAPFGVSRAFLMLDGGPFRVT